MNQSPSTGQQNISNIHVQLRSSDVQAHYRSFPINEECAGRCGTRYNIVSVAAAGHRGPPTFPVLDATRFRNSDLVVIIILL